MQTTMLEEPTTMIALTTVSTSHADNADNDVRRTNNDDSTDYCVNLSTLTSNADNDVRSGTNNTGDILSTLTTANQPPRTLTAMQTTMLEAPTTMTTLTPATTSAH